jgi:5-methylcytosine-specific restriction protein A
MANKTQKYCVAFPCSNMAEPGSSYCKEHRPARAPKETDAFYLSVQWRKFREWYLSRHPLCEQCEKEGRLTRAAMVDHIIEIKDGGALTSEDNAMSMCLKCHGKKTAKAKNHRKGSTNNRPVSQRETY